MLKIGNIQIHLDILCLDFIRDLDKVIRTIALVVMSGDEVIEADKSESEMLGLGVLKTSEDNLHDRHEVLLQCRARRRGQYILDKIDRLIIHLRWEVCDDTLQKVKSKAFIGFGGEQFLEDTEDWHQLLVFQDELRATRDNRRQ